MIKYLGVIFVVLITILSETHAGLPAVGVEYIGCYKDPGYQARAFREVIYDAKDQLDWNRWKNLSYIVQICAEKAANMGRGVFAVQDWAECRSDRDENRYKTFKNSTKCYTGVGRPWINAVYRIKCDDGDKTRYFSESPESCQDCKCHAGLKSCKTMECDYKFNCEKYGPPQQHKCCRTCECNHLGKPKMNGEEWADRRVPGECNQCRCINGETSCQDKVFCAESCLDPEYIPGKCCPRCRPKAPATEPWEVITLPPTRPRPTFPPWMRRPGSKRTLRMKTSQKSKRFA